MTEGVLTIRYPDGREEKFNIESLVYTPIYEEYTEDDRGAKISQLYAGYTLTIEVDAKKGETEK